MKALYYLRVFFISYEFAFLISGSAIYIFFGEYFEKQFISNPINENALQWAMLFPISVSGWTLKEGVGVIFPDDRTTRILHEWPDYWRLKCHFNVGILNTIIYLIPCLAIWFTGGLNKFEGAWLFFMFAIATSINAFTFYTAKIGVRSALIRAHT
ncbi:hypothetical protein [Pseudomonas flexibilis]|uniref:hypothetical protein n=1 Tax=Pseudomonas flexibilis TaxID=706570 RepID=UPI001113A12E|nr:hypothetical protein [Pseudomonas flexibilis]